MDYIPTRSKSGSPAHYIGQPSGVSNEEVLGRANVEDIELKLVRKSPSLFRSHMSHGQ